MDMKRFWLCCLLLLLLALPALCQAEGTPVSLNDMIKTDSERIELRFLDSKNNAKTDATLLLCYGKERLEVLVVDGGLANSRCYMELLNLRKDLLSALNLSDQAKNKDYQLHLTLVATHSHKDHIAALYSEIIPCKFFAIDALYVSPATALVTDNTYDDSKNGDAIHRVRLLSTMRDSAPNAPVYTLDYAQALTFPLACGQATLYAPIQDYGVGDALTYIKNVYYPGQADKDIRADLPVAVVNANSMWLRVELGGSSALFTGDIMKKKSDREPMDRMIAHYGAETLRSDIVKYPHHGISRNPAAKPVSQLLLKEGGVVVLTTKGAREKAGQMLAIYDAAFVTTEDGTQTFTMTAESVTQP